MRALVVYESMFGNTRDIAAAVAEGLGTQLTVDLVEVGSAAEEVGEDVTLLVAGGPTHALGMSRAQTRRKAGDQAAEQAGEQADDSVVSSRIGLRDWLERLGPGNGLPAVTFDTRVRRPRIPGSAARRAERQLKKHGYGIMRDAENFWVTGASGPLVEGERERARRWGEQVGHEVRSRTTPG
jgi:hypothetical protein